MKSTSFVCAFAVALGIFACDPIGNKVSVPASDRLKSWVGSYQGTYEQVTIVSVHGTPKIDLNDAIIGLRCEAIVPLTLVSDLEAQGDLAACGSGWSGRLTLNLNQNQLVVLAEGKAPGEQGPIELSTTFTVNKVLPADGGI